MDADVYGNDGAAGTLGYGMGGSPHREESERLEAARREDTEQQGVARSQDRERQAAAQRDEREWHEVARRKESERFHDLIATLAARPHPARVPDFERLATTIVEATKASAGPSIPLPKRSSSISMMVRWTQRFFILGCINSMPTFLLHLRPTIIKFFLHLCIGRVMSFYGIKNERIECDSSMPQSMRSLLF